MDDDTEETAAIRRLWFMALWWFIGGLLCIGVSLTPMAGYLEQALTFLPVGSVRAALWLVAFACFGITFYAMPLRTITRHHLEWMGFCGKYCAILAAIAGSVVGYRIKSGITLPDDSAVVTQSHTVECVVLGVVGAAAGLVIGAVFGIILGLFVAKFTNPGSCPD